MLLGGLVVIAIIVLAVSPRHRALYLGGLGAASEERPRGISEASTPRSARAARARAVVRVTVPTEDAQGRVRVPVTDVMPATLPAGGVPVGWDVKEFAGRPDVELVRAEGRLALRLRSDASSFALYRDVVIDPNAQNRLRWSWKVTELPRNADGRDPARNDHAVGLYVAFPRWPAPLTSSEVLGYVWDSSAPVGTVITLPQAPNVRLIVVESGHTARGLWRDYERDVVRDYTDVFGTAPGRVGKLALMTDADHTRSAAEAFVADLLFSRR